MQNKVLDERVLELIFEYFKEEYQDLELTKNVEIDIVEFFKDAANKKLSCLQIAQMLRGSKIEEFRNNIIAQNPGNYKPYPIILGGLRKILREESHDKDFHMQRHILFILRNRIK